jgi:protein SCO1/2
MLIAAVYRSRRGPRRQNSRRAYGGGRLLALFRRNVACNFQGRAEPLVNPVKPIPDAAPVGGRRRIALVVALAIVAMVAVAVYPVWRAKSGGGASLVGGPFELQGPDGRVVTDADMKGQPFLVYFGYTNCPDVCPTTLAEISDVLARLPGKPIRALFITIDPERDTAQSLKDYVSSFDPRIIGLSGDRAAIDKVERAYRVYARKGPPEKGGYGMDHSSIVYLMDAQGRFVEAFNLERKPEDSAKELEEYL